MHGGALAETNCDPMDKR